MVAKPLRTKPKSASAERCLRSLGATIDMATPDMETSNCSCEGYIVAWRFTKRQPGGRGDYWVLSLSGNCCFKFLNRLRGGGLIDHLFLKLLLLLGGEVIGILW